VHSSVGKFFKQNAEHLIIGVIVVVMIGVGVFGYSREQERRLTSSLIQQHSDAVSSRPRPVARAHETASRDILVKFTGAGVQSAALTHQGKDFSVQSVSQQRTGLYKITVADQQQVAAALAQYNANPAVAYAEPNGLVRMTKTPNDSLYGEQWALRNSGQTGGTQGADIKAATAWDATTGSSSVIIAIVDTGVDAQHPDIKNKLVAGYNAIDNADTTSPTPNGTDDDGDGIIDGGTEHGTHVATTAAAESNNKQGIAGVCWSCRIMPIKALDDEGNGTYLDIANGIDWAVAHGASIINLSLGGSYSNTIDDAIKNAAAHNVIVIAAAGNEGSNLDEVRESPVCNDGGDGSNNVIGVAALDDTDTKASFSNYGAGCVDIAAPGESILAGVFHDPSHGFTDYYANFSGTSMAAPIVAGVAGLVKSQHPTWTAAQIRTKLLSSVDSVAGKNPAYAGKLGSGRINALKAVQGSSALISANGTKIVVGAGAGDSTQVRGYTPKGSPTSTSFAAFGTGGFHGGVHVALGDIDGDDEDEIIVGAGAGGGPQIRVFEKDGTLRGIQFFAFDTRFRGGVNVATGDVDGDGKDEITACQASLGQAWCKIYHYNNKKTVIAEWNAFGADEYGASVAMGDMNKDGLADVIVGQGPGGKALIRVFDGAGKKRPIEIIAFDPSARSGVAVAAGDTDGDGRAEIGACLGAGQEAWCKLYQYNSAQKVLANFRAFPAGFTGGATIAIGDIDNNGITELIVGAGPGGGPQVRVFSATGKASASNFMSLDGKFRGGIFVAAQK